MTQALELLAGGATVLVPLLSGVAVLAKRAVREHTTSTVSWTYEPGRGTA
jgi:hypothetical protein